MRRFRALAVLATAVVLTAGCTSAASSGAAPGAWARQQEHVAAAELLPYDEADEGTYLRVTLDDGLPDATVESVVQGLKEHFDDEDDRPSIEVDVDGFVGSVYPGLVTFADGVSDADLDRALWLRADGRALSYDDTYDSTTSTRKRVVAPAPLVAQLAIDFDAAVTHDHDVRQSWAVESDDGTTGVQWEVAQGLGFALNTAVVGQFAALQRAHPGTTGWLISQGGPYEASYVFNPAEVTFAEVASGSLVDAGSYRELELGWGVARAPADRFAEVFADPGTRAELDALREVDGVTEVGEDGVVVSTGRAFAAARAYAATTEYGVRISLQREPVLYDYPTEPVFTSSGFDPAPIVAAYAAVADRPAVVGLALSTHSPFGNLTVDDEATLAELTLTFDALLMLPAPYERTEVYGSVPASYGRDTQIALGTATAAGFTVSPEVEDRWRDLAGRVEQAWDDARAG